MMEIKSAVVSRRTAVRSGVLVFVLFIVFGFYFALIRLPLKAIFGDWRTVSDSQSSQTTSLRAIRFSTQKGSFPYFVEVADNAHAREIGLMNRRYLPADGGMIFIFPDAEPRTFWMKNTYIPLDMIFVTREGVIHHIAERAEPLSTAFIPSSGDCLFVVELNAGQAEKMGLKVGDSMHDFVEPAMRKPS